MDHLTGDLDLLYRIKVNILFLFPLLVFCFFSKTSTKPIYVAAETFVICKEVLLVAGNFHGPLGPVGRVAKELAEGKWPYTGECVIETSSACMSDSCSCLRAGAVSGNRERVICCAVFEAVTVANTSINVFRDMTPYCFVEIYRRFIFYLEDRGNTFLRNVGAFIPDYTALLPGRRSSFSKHRLWVSIF